METTYYIGYKLHKDGSPVIECCYSEEQKEKILKKLKDEKYNPQVMSLEQSNEMLEAYGKRFVPKPLTQEERWYKWRLGH